VVPAMTVCENVVEMRYTTVRIRSDSLDVLRSIAAREHSPMPAVLDRAIETYRRQAFLEAVNAAYGRLRNDPAAWGAVEDERAIWDATLEDGLEAPATIAAPRRRRKPAAGKRRR